MPGKTMSKLNLKQQHHLCFELFRICGFTCNRIDTAIDDSEKSIPVSTIKKALNRGNYKGFKEFEFKGDTLYLGSSKSNEFTRFYNTLHNHGFDADRWELQLRDTKAHRLFTAIAINQFTSEKYIAKFLVSNFLDSISFVNRTNARGKKEKNLSRCSMLPWWKTFTESTLSSYQ
jgi:DNA relaxase NicK